VCPDPSRSIQIARDLPADIREGIEDRIAELSALIDAKAAKPS
jgi:hypothetical protein